MKTIYYEYIMSINAEFFFCIIIDFDKVKAFLIIITDLQLA